MAGHKFDPKKLDRLNDPERLALLDLDQVIELFCLDDCETDDCKTMVDLGAGTGLYAEAFLDRLPNAICHAFDIKAVFVDWMREHRRHAKQGCLLPALMKEVHIPLADQTVDFLFMISLHHELDAPVELLLDCRRVLVPGGGLMVADWDPSRMSDGDGPPRDHLLDPGVTHGQMVEAGFTDVKFFDASSRYYCIAGTAA